MRKVLYHTFLWIIALSILNSSVDVVETNLPVTHKSTDKVQDDEIESIVEFIMDEASNHQDRLPDSKNNEEQTTLKKAVSFDFSLPVKKEKLLSPIITNLNNKLEAVNSANLLPPGFTSLLIQPPDLS